MHASNFQPQASTRDRVTSEVSGFKFQVMRKSQASNFRPPTPKRATLHDDGLRRHFSLAGSRLQLQSIDRE